MTEKSEKWDLNYGPLAPLIGSWYGESGTDISPEEEGEERNPYREELTFEPLKDLSNAEEQALMVLHYRQKVTRTTDDKVIHNECGYYSWDAENELIIKSFSIGRGVAIVAGGKALEDGNKVTLQLRATKEDADWGIIESPFMQQKASTQAYRFELSVEADKLVYFQSVRVNIFGREFDHTDTIRLHKVVA